MPLPNVGHVVAMLNIYIFKKKKETHYQMILFGPKKVRKSVYVHFSSINNDIRMAEHINNA